MTHSRRHGDGDRWRIVGRIARPGYILFCLHRNRWNGRNHGQSAGPQLTVATGNLPQFTFPNLQAGNSARNLYLGAVGGPTGGPYSLYATGITTTTFTAAWQHHKLVCRAPPTTNSTAFSYTDANGHTLNYAYQYIRSRKTAISLTYTGPWACSSTIISVAILPPGPG